MLRNILTKMKTKKGRAGFTLLELIITMTIVAIISIATFTIVMSAMDTFKKQKDVIEANDMKNTICMTIREHLRKRTRIFMVNENLYNVDNNAGVPQVKINNVDEYGNYVEDPRLLEMHMLYSRKGRLFSVTSNPEGKYYVKKTLKPDSLVAYPTKTNGMVGSDPANILKGEWGRESLLDERFYGKFYVDVRFLPLYTNTQGKYRDMQIFVTIYDDASMAPDRQVASGTETFHLLNIENRQDEIKFQNDKQYMIDNPTAKEPQKAGAYGTGYTFCYFV